MLLLPAMSGLYLAITQLEGLGVSILNEDTLFHMIDVELGSCRICLSLHGLII